MINDTKGKLAARLLGLCESSKPKYPMVISAFKSTTTIAWGEKDVWEYDNDAYLMDTFSRYSDALNNKERDRLMVSYISKNKNKLNGRKV
jgi:hypothetical protein